MISPHASGVPGFLVKFWQFLCEGRAQPARRAPTAVRPLRVFWLNMPEPYKSEGIRKIFGEVRRLVLV